MLEFIEETHTYLFNNKKIPSVSQILSKTIFKDKYKDVPEFILKNKASFGTNVHKAIETDFWEGLNDEELFCYKQYVKLSQSNNLKVIAHEQKVIYKDWYAGTFDMTAYLGQAESLGDIKTTYSLDKEYLSWQLSMYELASGKQFEKLFAIWLPKNRLGKLLEIDRKSKEEIEKVVRWYYENNC